MIKMPVCIILYGTLVLTVIPYIINVKTVDDFTGIFAIVAAIVSVIITIWLFRMKSTLDKIQVLTLNPDTAPIVVKVLDFIKKANSPFSRVTITKESVKTDKELFASVIFLLGFGDDLGIAIKQHLVDESLVKSMIGKFLVNLYTSMAPYIKAVREDKGDVYYAGFEEMCERWKLETENETKHTRLD